MLPTKGSVTKRSIISLLDTSAKRIIRAREFSTNVPKRGSGIVTLRKNRQIPQMFASYLRLKAIIDVFVDQSRLCAHSNKIASSSVTI